ncbi:MAG: UTP--glucose-1-phosphate uridylyltransferase GalU [Alphaproteobacteria bacterium]|nr:UTP--glucose-1-phosphate uridylyltransferase GalU [Alphaproteobacteria bacterium]
MPIRVRKAVFPVGGLGTRFLPATKAMPKEMLPLVDKPLIHHAVEEARAAGIEEFIFVTGRGKSTIEDHFDQSYELEEQLSAKGKQDMLEALRAWLPTPGKVAYTRQQEPLGLGHAVWCARHLIGNEPFAVLLADDVFLGPSPCLKQMTDVFEGQSMVAVETIDDESISSYGVLKVAKQVRPSLVQVSGLVEKPRREEAPSNLAVVGRYILTPKVFEFLDRKQQGAGGEIQLTDALSWLAGLEPFYGVKIAGERFDCGSKSGYLRANIAFALERADLRDDLIEYLSNLSIERKRRVAAGGAGR